MHEVTITGLTRVSRPSPNRAGFSILAYFDCEFAGVALRGCAFCRTPKNGLTVWPPKMEGPEGERRCIIFTEDSLRHAIMQQAQDAYRALGGTDGEWIPRQTESEGLNRFLNGGAE